MKNIDEHADITLFFKTIGNALMYFFKDTYTVLVGIASSFIGYLLPIKDIVNLLIVFFIADVIFGFWAANLIKKERFSVKIIWGHTMPRMLVSIFLIVSTYLWDKVYEQEIVSTYKIVGWFISGVLLCSISENGYKITKWSVFSKLGIVINKNIKEKTEIDLNENND